MRKAGQKIDNKEGRSVERAYTMIEESFFQTPGYQAMQQRTLHMILAQARARRAQDGAESPLLLAAASAPPDHISGIAVNPLEQTGQIIECHARIAAKKTGQDGITVFGFFENPECVKPLGDKVLDLVRHSAPLKMCAPEALSITLEIKKTEEARCNLEASSLTLPAVIAVYCGLSGYRVPDDIVFSGHVGMDGSLDEPVADLRLKAVIAWQQGKNVLVLPKANEHDPALKTLDPNAEGRLCFLFFATLEELIIALHQADIFQKTSPQTVAAAPHRIPKTFFVGIMLFALCCAAGVYWWWGGFPSSLMQPKAISTEPPSRHVQAEHTSTVFAPPPDHGEVFAREEALFRVAASAAVHHTVEARYPYHACLSRSAQQENIPVPIVIGLMQALADQVLAEASLPAKAGAFMRFTMHVGAGEAGKSILPDDPCETIKSICEHFGELYRAAHGNVSLAACRLLHQRPEYSWDMVTEQDKAFVQQVADRVKSVVAGSLEFYPCWRYDTLDKAESLKKRLEACLLVPVGIEQGRGHYTVYVPVGGEEEKDRVREKIRACTGLTVPY